jgi:hypothetical protein
MLATLYVMFWGVIGKDMVLNAEHGDTYASIAWIRAMEYVKASGVDEPLWNPYPFGGMPFYSGLMFPENVNYIQTAVIYIGWVLFMGSNHAYELAHLFLAGIGAYLLARSLGQIPMVSLLGGFTYMLYPQAIGLIASSHGGKLATWAMIPYVFMLTIRLVNKTKAQA